MGLSLAVPALERRRRVVSYLPQQLVRAILAPPGCQRENLDCRIRQDEADQHADSIEQQHRRSLVFRRGAQLCDALRVLGTRMIDLPERKYALSRFVKHRIDQASHQDSVVPTVRIARLDNLVLHAAGYRDLAGELLLGLNNGIVDLVIPLHFDDNVFLGSI